MLENQSFQSVLQLAVALNIGFAALATLYGNTISKERIKISSLLETAKTYRDLAIEKEKYDASGRSAFSEVVKLRNEISNTVIEVDNFIFRWARFAAIACALISFALLGYSTLNATGEASNWVIFGSLVVNLPFIGFVVYSAIHSMKVAEPLRGRRELLDKTLQTKLEDILAT
ncbi:MAG: hypothetical protein AAFN63_10110 [Pseudomonadota bacterium]